MPDDFGATAVNTRVHSYHPTSHTGLRVHRAPGIPHALDISGAKVSSQPRTHCAARTQRCVGILHLSSPAKAGDPVFQRRQQWNREAAAYWIPAFAGMTGGG